MVPDEGDSLATAFVVGLESALGRPLGANERLGIAVSGGPDSMALLDLAHACLSGRVEAATVDHGLRPEAADEAAMVASYCAVHGIAHATLRPEMPIAGSIQAEARTRRYALLEGWMARRGLDWLLTAHHADDQLETMLMRLNRASGVSGLAGVRARRGHVLRPLLSVRKAVLRAYAEQRAIPFVDDPSNADVRFDRVRMRDALSAGSPVDALAAARSASALADAEAALDWTVERLWTERVREEARGLCLTDADLPRECLRRLLARMVREVAPDTPEPRGEQLEQAIVQLIRGRKISIGGCVASGGTRWTVERAPPRRTG